MGIEEIQTLYVGIAQTRKLVSLYANLPFIFEWFMTYNVASSAKSIAKVPNQKVNRRPNYFLSFFFFIFFFVPCCVIPL